MDLFSYYKFLMGTDPTPEQARLFQEKRHGFSIGTWDWPKFTATLILAMHLAYDSEHRVYRQVIFAYPKSMEKQVVQGIQTLLDQFRKKLPSTKGDLQKRARNSILQRMRQINLGSRVYATKEAPPYWVAYGFASGTLVPPWLQDGLLE